LGKFASFERFFTRESHLKTGYSYNGEKKTWHDRDDDDDDTKVLNNAAAAATLMSLLDKFDFYFVVATVLYCTILILPKVSFSLKLPLLC